MNLLLTGAYPYTEEQKKALADLGYSVYFLQYENDAIDPDTARKINAIVCNGLFLHNDIDLFDSLKFIQLTSAGLDRVPVETIRRKDIALYNAKDVYSIPMAEWAVFKVLEYFKRAEHFREAAKKHEWLKNRNVKELSGCTVGIIGAGSVGMETAKRFKAFGTKILTADIIRNGSPVVDRSFLMDEIEAFLPLCDAVILTVPLNRDTCRYIDKDKLKLMKPEAVLVNISRGAVVNETDLTDALRDNTIAYAALDVFEKEPLPETSPLWDLKNVSITPHNSFVSDRNADRMFRLMYDNLKGFADKKLT